MRWLIVAAGVGGALLVESGLRAASMNEAGAAEHEVKSALVAAPPVIQEIVLVGLRHIAPGAVYAQISSHPGAQLNSQRIQSDVKVLGRLGWFGDIQVETQPTIDPALGGISQSVRLVFHLVELPYLAKIEYAGSRLLSSAQIEKLLNEKRLNPRLGEPASPVNLQKIAQAIQSALAELGHPHSQVKINRETFPNATVHIRYVINDGPHIPVGQIDFEGHPEISAKLLRHEMQRTAPGALFASLRNKGAYTPQGFEEDRSRILIYYQNHGYPEARVGMPHASVYEKNSSRWTPWPFRKTEKRLAISVPIEAGQFYTLESVDVAPEIAATSGKRGRKLLAFSKVQARSAYSAKAIEDLRHAWLTVSQGKLSEDETNLSRSIQSSRTLDMQAHKVQVHIAYSDAPPYIVRRIEFRGLHRFSDRYLRRRIGLQEGQPFEEHVLETGLARLARTGYFHNIRKEDVHVVTNDFNHTADVSIQVSEAGQQRVSFSGGMGQFGSTLGIAYSLFDLLQREELLSAQLDGGPDSLQIALGLVMEGFLGSRGSLAISIFDNVLRPRFASSAKGPFYNSQSDGLNTGWSYPLTNTDSVAVNYSLSHTNTDYSTDSSASPIGPPSTDVRAKTSSSAVGLSWLRDSGSERLSLMNSVSGGLLGGTENVLRSNEEYARIFPDPLFNHQNAWAFRTTFSAAGSYQGDMPLYARLFSGDAQVRGLNPGELGPYAEVSSFSSSGNQTYSAVPAGANLVAAANAEYRVPLRGGAQAVGFFDLGSGWLLPNWLGKDRPTLLDSTNGILHGSMGIELRWTVPEIQVPVRAYYAVNVLRLNRFYQLADGSLFHAHNRLFAFGWALGTLF